MSEVVSGLGCEGVDGGCCPTGDPGHDGAVGEPGVGETVQGFDFDAYQKAATEFAIYGAGNKVVYPTLGLTGEAGELANKVKKVLRDDGGSMSEAKANELAGEIGDVLWYCAALASDLGYSLGSIAVGNIQKLLSRKQRGVLQGSGDNR